MPGGATAASQGYHNIALALGNRNYRVYVWIR